MDKVHISDDMIGFILDKSVAVNSPKRMENVKILIANTGEPSTSQNFPC